MKITKSAPLALLVSAAVVSGCATGSKDIKSSYVSPMTYDAYTCDQLVQENQRIQLRVSSAAGDVDKRASGDKVKMGVGLVLFWPTLFFLKGNGPEQEEYARLKGEHEAIEETYIRKNCANELATRASNASSTDSSAQTQQPAAIRASTYQGSGASAARVELSKMQCDDNFNQVSESGGRGVYEATCKNGKRQLMECWSGTCRTLN